MMATLLWIAAKGLFTLVVAFALFLGLRRSSAAVRHAVLFTALAGLAGLGVGAFLLPTWPVPILRSEARPVAAAPRADDRPVSTAVSRTDRPEAKPIPSERRDNRPTAASVATDAARMAVRSIAWPSLWIAGALLTLIPWCLGRLAAARLLRRAHAAPAAWSGLVRELSRTLDLSQVPDVAVVDHPMSPLTFGWRDLHVLLPSEAAGWSSERLRTVLLHELAHVKRRDDLTHTIARVGCVLHWFNPLAWLALKRLRCERELACDDLVLRHGHAPAEYAATLVELAHALQRQTQAAGRNGLSIFAGFAGLAGMAEPTTLELRVRALLDGARRRQPPRRGRAALGTATAALALALLACALPARASVEAAASDASAELRERIAAARERALKDLHHLHFVVTGQEWDWNDATQIWEASKARWHVRAWYEGGPDERFRVDQDPRIGVWIHGARPFCEFRDSVAWDGTLFRKYSHGYSDGWYRSSLAESRPYYPTYVEFEGIQGRERKARSFSLFGLKIPLGETPGALRPHSEVGEFIRRLDAAKGVSFEIAQDEQGMTVIALHYGDVGTAQYRLDPTKNYATVSELTTWSANDGRISWQATAWKQMSPDLWLPTAWDEQVRFTDRSRSHRNTVVLDSAGYFSPKDADAIFAMADVDTTRRSHDPPAGPDFADVAGPP